MRILAKNIRDRRLRLGLTQQELAERAGLSLKYVSYVETGSRNPAIDTALKLAEALGTTLDPLCEIERDPSRDSAPEMERLLDFVRRLDKAKRRKALALIRTAFGTGG